MNIEFPFNESMHFKQTLVDSAHYKRCLNQLVQKMIEFRLDDGFVKIAHFYSIKMLSLTLNDEVLPSSQIEGFDAIESTDLLRRT